MNINTETLIQICHKNKCDSICPLSKTGLCDEGTPFDINWEAVQAACKKYELDTTYNWIKIDEDEPNIYDILEDKCYYLASIEGIKTPVKVLFIHDAEIGFECNINHKKTFIRLYDNKVKYITNLPELPKEEQ